jgi:PIN domain nuclease of toxin-antitoxin system
MIVAIADTHTASWCLFSDPRLGKAASAFIDATVASGDHIGISAISLTEMVSLIIAATASFQGIPVLSRDGRIRASNIKTTW